MKTIITKSAICVILATLLSGGLNAQTYPDYLFGTTSPQTMNAMIRQYSPTAAVSVDVYRLYDVIGVLGYNNHPDCSLTFTSHSVVHSPVASSVRITCF